MEQIMTNELREKFNPYGYEDRQWVQATETMYPAHIKNIPAGTLGQIVKINKPCNGNGDFNGIWYPTVMFFNGVSIMCENHLIEILCNQTDLEIAKIWEWDDRKYAFSKGFVLKK